MKQLVILSGKGGTGKTTIVASFIRLSKNKAFADCDVDAPNLHLIHQTKSHPRVEHFCGYQKAVKYDTVCIGCGKCEHLCQFGAIHKGIVNRYECEGCGVCEAFCPAEDQNGNKAIRLEQNVSGKTILYNENNEIFSSAELEMGNGASGKLVTQVRKNLKDALIKNDLVIIDGSPGIGCPVIASIAGVDMVLLVAEPTLSGIHDMERIMKTAERFNAKIAVCINKYDINLINAQKIETLCRELNIPMVGNIPFDPKVIEYVNEGKSIIEASESRAKDAIVEIWQSVYSLLLA